MKIEIIAIGNEILAGYTVNGNAAFVGRALTMAGFPPTSHTVVSDEPAQLKSVLIRALSENDIVITTGGLGPTLDDLTRGVVADIMGVHCTFNHEVKARLAKRLGVEMPTLDDQATIPETAIPIHNQVGTAPGLIFERASTLILLPGVPVEMEAMVTDQVVPYLGQRWPKLESSERVELGFFAIAEARVDVELRRLASLYPQVSFGIYPQLGAVLVRLEGVGVEEPANKLANTFKENVLPRRFTSLDEAIHTTFVERGLTLSLAESCTGGFLASRLIARPGASDYFLGSLVTYANEWKENFLKVDKTTMVEQGAVSSACAREMLEGLLEGSGSDYGVAITGIAGPSGATDGKPVGLVYIGVGRRGGPIHVMETRRHLNRGAVIIRSCNLALAELWKLVTTA